MSSMFIHGAAQSPPNEHVAMRKISVDSGHGCNIPDDDGDDVVIRTQPTGQQPTNNSLYNSSEIHKEFDPADNDQCCMCKIGNFMYGFPNEETLEETRRQSGPRSQSVISRNSDSAFSELSSSRHQSFLAAPSNSPEALIESFDYIHTDCSHEHLKPFRNRSKRVSFAIQRDAKENEDPMDVSNMQSTETNEKILNQQQGEQTNSLHAAKEEDNECDFILQCIKDSAQFYELPSHELSGKRFELENFAAIFIGKDFGAATLKIPGTDIFLYIPPNAMLKEKPELVYIYQPNEKPHLASDSKEAWATPIIKCGPSGLKFSKPVFLSLPYTLAVDASQMSVSAYHSKRFSKTGGKWEGLRDGDDTVVVPQDKGVTILIDNFCRYGCTVQQDASKWMHASVQVDHEEDRKCTIGLQLCDIDQVQSQKGEGERGRQSSVILVNNNGGPMNISINGVDRRWKLSKGSFQQISCEQLWSSQSPLKVTFCAELKADADDVDFGANVDIYQDDNDQPRASLPAISTRHNSLPTPDKTAKFQQVRQTIDQQFLQTAINQSPHFMRQDSHQNLCAELDTAIESCGWKQLANQIGFERMTTIRWMDHYSKQSGNYSPGSILIDFYLKDTTDDNITEKLQCLSNFLLHIDNGAAKRYVDEEISLRIRANELQVALDSLAETSNPSNTTNLTPARQNRVVRATSIAWSKTKNSLTTFGEFIRRRSQHDRHVSGNSPDQTNYLESMERLDYEFGGENNQGFGASEDTAESESHKTDRHAESITQNSGIPKVQVSHSSGDESSSDSQPNNNIMKFFGLQVPFKTNRKISTESHDSGMGQSRPCSGMDRPSSYSFPAQQIMSDDWQLNF
ncbi:uncharacterized protein [Amphiura filiformis]|uniref:uncharacterized protein n=1 Tax=Amphiura filiformis TaxID=82378 RepID=UPI003B21C668